MVLAKLLSVAGRRRLLPGQVVALSDLDRWLDVPTDRFPNAVTRLGAEFAKARASLDLAAYRVDRRVPANLAGSQVFPDVRDTFYQSDLRRIVPMDREEEFRMARRHEFLATLVKGWLVKFGVEEAEAGELVRGTSRAVLARVAPCATPRGLDRAWFARLAEQLEELRNLYVEGALSVVLSTVNRYRNLGVDTADLIQEGNASLFQAIDGFDWRRDVRFRTYAQYWVHQAVLKMLYNSSRTVRVPIWVQKILGKIRRVQDEARRRRAWSRADACARSPSVIDISAGASVAWVLATRRYSVSLDAEIAGTDGASLVQMLPDESLPPIPESIPAGDLRQALADAMADLPERERRILHRRFGLDGAEPQTLGEIATELGITAERVRQLQNAALGRIKRPAKLRQLQAFVE
jgi:RNA polymerase nonessential primary-like sigma factor